MCTTHTHHTPLPPPLHCHVPTLLPEPVMYPQASVPETRSCVCHVICVGCATCKNSISTFILFDRRITAQAASISVSSCACQVSHGWACGDLHRYSPTVSLFRFQQTLFALVESNPTHSRASAIEQNHESLPQGANDLQSGIPLVLRQPQQSSR